MRVMRTIDRFLERVMSVHYSPYLVVVVPIVIACFRSVEELWWEHHAGGVGAQSYVVVHTFALVLFYTLMQLLMAGSLALASGRRSSDMLGPVSVGLAIAWFPPIIDLAVPDHLPRGHYSFFRDFDWDLFARHQAFGESIMLWAMVVISALIVLWLTRNLWRALLGAALAYLVIQALGWGWPNLANRVSEWTGTREIATRVGYSVLIALLGVFAAYVIQRRHALGRSLIRVNHALPWGLLAGVAARIAGQPWHEVILRSLVITFAAQLFIVANDYWDREQDSGAGGSALAAGREDCVIAIYLQVLLGLWVVQFRPNGIHGIALLVGIFALYHMHELRLKKLFWGGYMAEGFGAAGAILFGAQNAQPGGWVPGFVALAIGGFALASMFKDYEDIERDRAAGVGTIYTHHLAKGRSLTGIHAFVRSSLVVMLVVPGVWLIAMAEPWLPAVGLIAIALVIGGWLLGLRSRKLAVESALWGLDGYLLAMMFLVPALR